MVDLQLKKAELDRKLAIQESKNVGNPTSLGVARPLDRTELLRMLKDDGKTETKDK
jgi:hypothetical protein